MAPLDQPLNALRARLCLDRPGFGLDVELEAAPRGVTAVFGPSGSGKTTLLRCLAGLEAGVRGYICVGGEQWQDDASGLFVPAHRRPLGYVFQDGRLFPHLTVHDNLCYGARRASVQAGAPSFKRTVEILGLAHLLQRRPHQLSGGEQQRVAVGRALLAAPRLLLMDEPMASLDTTRRREIMPFLEDLHRELALPVLYVTHALEELTRLADHVVLLEGGRVQGSGPVSTVLSRLDLPLARGEEAVALIDARVAEHDDDYGLTQVEFSGGRLLLARQSAAVGDPLRVLIHARDVSLALRPATDSSILNILPGTVSELAEGPGSQVTARLQAGDAAVLARITRKSRDRLGLRPGMQVYAQIKSVALAR
ncbi:MAG: molybdenum ABC transporter ATP-binding protein [Gammaproteobacteria bacterium]|nr:molybdenum ABC transporter ATP-binding protein [Gammaproteobacteria bacterium]NIR98039.1 molybdenum ABC transporter ATP-binding protein [Gammaproteobacteria bacterium]NIT63746.1 molybdenum ABC transporter ATP-binding protein [Gammaproteobacteria bacterium]NIV19921.1 molybdenum ABC transporter ATP-binding protein [Gammaproteobacteria bacterium]NIX11410.1 molybdenum ABC transporter ATP-binding protein [Gammaproteobacteria bacterium]